MAEFIPHSMQPWRTGSAAFMKGLASWMLAVNPLAPAQRAWIVLSKLHVRSQ
jgi:hypothetical protein